jgi:hypothetical protein
MVIRKIGYEKPKLSKKAKKSSKSINPETQAQELDVYFEEQYNLKWRRNNRIKKLTYFVEVNGIKLNLRTTSKGIHYFQCSSHRLRNSSACSFRARIKGMDLKKSQGQIQIIKGHSETCKFIPGNETKVFPEIQA